MKIDMTGKQYGKMSVISAAESRTRPNGTVVTYWHCQCACGAKKEVSGAHLRNGSVVSCGCHKNQKASTRAIERNTSHGMSNHRVFHVWASMIQRCQNPNHKAWKWYGGKGIKVCDQWQTFEGFLTDMGIPANKMTLDRIDGNKGYQPDNCRWATMKTQQRNRCNNHILAIGAESKTIAEWSESTGINASTIARRAYAGKTGEALILIPSR